MKMYWKDGFYTTAVEGGVEITKEYWMELLEGQAEGKNIENDENGHPVLREIVISVENYRLSKLAELAQYDAGSVVNAFTVNGEASWLDKATRASLASRIALADDDLKIGLWYGPTPTYTEVPAQTLAAMLAAIEDYAVETFNATQRHRAAIYALQTQEEIERYDISAGYPSQLSFTV